MFEWDKEKEAENLAKHGMDFSLCAYLEWHRAFVWEDNRVDYGERRLCALAQDANGRVFAVVYTKLNKTDFRIISLRPATRQERQLYEENA
jgi:uncharacterized DUF497 family protein